LLGPSVRRQSRGRPKASECASSRATFPKVRLIQSLRFRAERRIPERTKRWFRAANPSALRRNAISHDRMRRRRCRRFCLSPLCLAYRRGLRWFEHMFLNERERHASSPWRPIALTGVGIDARMRQFISKCRHWVQCQRPAHPSAQDARASIETTRTRQSFRPSEGVRSWQHAGRHLPMSRTSIPYEFGRFVVAAVAEISFIFVDAEGGAGAFDA
jgi:hypothetical protein